MIIYKATNMVNGKVYIGQTIHSLYKRKQRHLNNARKGVNTHFYQAIRKYGEDAFKFEVICKVNNKDELNELETYYISKYNSIKDGYNMVDGGSNNVMFIPDVKAKHLAKLRTPETRKRISDGMKKYRAEHPFTEEHRKKLSEKAKGNHNFGNSDTRSVPCYCIVESGEIYHFHNYLQAGKWWYDNYKPFPYSICTYQRKIKQSIELGYSTYGSRENKQIFKYPKWYREDGDVIEVNSNTK